jgi:hypothetical protein
MSTTVIKKTILAIFVLITNESFAQDTRIQNELNDDYRSCIQKMYDILYRKDTITEFSDIYFLHKIDNVQISKYFFDLTQGISYESMCLLIKNVEIQDEGIGFSDYAILTFKNKKKVFFLLGAETPTEIVYIWLNDGEDLYDKLHNKKREVFTIQWQGIINKPFAELHEKADKNSKITEKLMPNQVFDYSPIGVEWWPVYDHGKLKGYIKKEDIIKFEDFPKKLKGKLQNRC